MSATATMAQPKPSQPASPMMPASEPPKLTHAVFLQHMTAMNAHYKAANSNGGTGPTHVYPLPVHLMAPPAAKAHPSQGSAEVDAALNASKASTTAFAGTENRRERGHEQAAKRSRRPPSPRR